MDIDRRIEELAAQRRDFMMRIANIKLMLAEAQRKEASELLGPLGA